MYEQRRKDEELEEMRLRSRESKRKECKDILIETVTELEADRCSDKHRQKEIFY